MIGVQVAQVRSAAGCHPEPAATPRDALLLSAPRSAGLVLGLPSRPAPALGADRDKGLLGSSLVRRCRGGRAIRARCAATSQGAGRGRRRRRAPRAGRGALQPAGKRIPAVPWRRVGDTLAVEVSQSVGQRSGSRGRGSESPPGPRWSGCCCCRRRCFAVALSGSGSVAERSDRDERR